MIPSTQRRYRTPTRHLALVAGTDVHDSPGDRKTGLEVQNA